MASPDVLRPAVGAMLAALGVYRVFRHRHTRWAGMKVSMSRLTLWSFMMATAHGAGLMVVPVVLGTGAVATAAVTGSHHQHHAAHVAVPDPVLAAIIHSLGYLVVTALAAWIVYTRIGLGVLRSSWINLDWVWAGALVLTGVLTAAL